MSTKEEYQKRAESELETSGAQIESWSAKAAQSEGDVKIEYERQLDVLRDIQSRGEASLDELKKTGEDNWETVRARMDGVLSELRNAILNISSRLH
jgi:hypothetical protein